MPTVLVTLHYDTITELVTELFLTPLLYCYADIEWAASRRSLEAPDSEQGEITAADIAAQMQADRDAAGATRASVRRAG